MEDINTRFNENMSKILNLQLVFEDYEDNTGIKQPLLYQIYGDIHNLRQDRDNNNLSDEDKILRSNAILNNFEELFDIVGKDKFIFYEDGGIGYKWDMSLLKEDYNRLGEFEN